MSNEVIDGIGIIHDDPTVAVETAPAPRVIALIATIPSRKRSCERLLAELARQSRKPDGVILVLDGYGEAPAPACSLPVVAGHRTTNLAGAGARWLTTHDLPPDDIIICLDDDIMLVEAPNLIKNLATAVESTNGAAAAAGRGTDNKFAPPGAYSRGELIYAAGCGLAVRAKHLVGLQEFAAGIRAGGGPDALGLLGDDDAVVSAHLWKTGVKIRHVATGNIYAASGTRSTSQTAARTAQRQNPDAQKVAIRNITGWPWAVPVATQPVGVRR